MKQKLAFFSAALLLLACLGGGNYYYRDFYRAKQPRAMVSLGGLSSIREEDPVFLVAHRGLSAVAPENTVPAIRQAALVGYYAAEFDIQETADGQWAVMHDEGLFRMTDGWEKIAKRSLAELRELRVTNGANIALYPDLRIPSLEDILDICEEGGIRPQIEIKAGSPEALEGLIALLRERNLMREAMLISFEQEILIQLHTLAPELEIWYLIPVLDSKQLALCLDTPDFRVAFNGNHRKNTPEAIRAFQDAGLALSCWTIDDPAVLERLYNLGIRHFTTNLILPG